METIFFSLIIGIVLGVCFTFLKLKQKYQQKIQQLSQKILYLENKEKKRLKNAEIYKNKLKSQGAPVTELELTNYQQQVQYIKQCALSYKKPINWEAVKYFYYLNEWIQKNQLNWYVSFEVSMGAFIRTSGKEDAELQKLAFSSYNSKRVDFLLIDHQGNPRGVIEYHGSGHYLSDDANERMQVKMLVLDKVGIPLIEIPELLVKKAFFERLQVLL
ncbi:unnamed protein product [Commensalibacter communis]|uniref:DUF2726 domain-containing protein n=1 Tax=Commensalibacter communis TaxID=2972786 RepID=UPI0022FF8843|nr:DUF2726 domain-containing protein [Commensalibacter communis]CAI3926535.1 unnamed protein product [Commensalibacter communis]CAI3932611.1 unnamed protein product [Commensalibacter communis]